MVSKAIAELVIIIFTEDGGILGGHPGFKELLGAEDTLAPAGRATLAAASTAASGESDHAENTYYCEMVPSR